MPAHRRTHLRPHWALVAALLVPVLAAGCSDDPGDPDGPNSSESSGSTAAGSPDPTSQTTSEASTEPSPSSDAPTSATTEPSGKLITMDGASFRLPPKYKASSTGRLLTLSTRQVDGNLDLLNITTQTNLGVIDTLATNIKNHNAGQIAYLYPPKTLDPVTIDGTELYHVAGKVNDSQWGEAFGGDTAGYLVDFSFLFDLRVDPKERDQIIEDFLASIELTDSP